MEDDVVKYFNQLADKILQDPPLLEMIEYAESPQDIYDILYSGGYVDIDMMDYMLLALDARDKLMHYLDPDTGDLSVDALNSTP